MRDVGNVYNQLDLMIFSEEPDLTLDQMQRFRDNMLVACPDLHIIVIKITPILNYTTVVRQD